MPITYYCLKQKGTYLYILDDKVYDELDDMEVV